MSAYLPPELRELQSVEQRLLKERQEAEKLEQQIRQLALGGGSSFESANVGVPSRRAPPVPPNGNGSPAVGQNGKFLQSGDGVRFEPYAATPSAGLGFFSQEQPSLSSQARNNVGGVSFASALASSAKKAAALGGSSQKKSAGRRRFDYGDDDSEEEEDDEDEDEDEEDEDDEDGGTAGTTETEKEERRRAIARGDYSKVKGSGYGQPQQSSSSSSSKMQQNNSNSSSGGGLRSASRRSRRNDEEDEEDESEGDYSDEEDEDDYDDDDDDDYDGRRRRRRQGGGGGGRRRRDRSPSSQTTGTMTTTSSAAGQHATTKPRGPIGLAPVSSDSPINLHKRQASATGRAGVAYRSPFYRSVSPSRKVGKERVVVSNFARAPRFREEKAWVPGPKYNTKDTEFTPTAVFKDGGDLEGPPGTTGSSLGHTWSRYHASTGVAPSLQDQHELAMMRATLREQDVLKEAAMTPSSSSKGGKRSRSKSKGKGGDDERHQHHAVSSSPASAAALLIQLNGGDPRLALEAAVSRERAMRKEVENLQRQIRSQKLNAASVSGNLRGEAEHLTLALSTKVRALEDAVGRAAEGRDYLRSAQSLLSGVQRAINELGATLATVIQQEQSKSAASAYASQQGPLSLLSSRFPAMGRLVELVKQLGDRLGHVEKGMDSLLSQASSAASASSSSFPLSPSANGEQQLPSSPSAAGSAGAAVSGYLSYSSTAGAIAQVQAAQTANNSQSPAVGKLEGASLTLINGTLAAKAAQQATAEALENSQMASTSILSRRGRSAGPPPLSAARSPANPASIGSPGGAASAAKAVDLATKGIGRDDILAFARKTRQQTSVAEAQRNAANLIATAANEGFDVSLAQAAAEEDVHEAEEAYRKEMAMQQRLLPGAANAQHNPAATAYSSRSSSPSRSARKTGFSASISAAMGRSGAASPVFDGAGAAASQIGGGGGGSVIGGTRSPASKPVLRRVTAAHLMELPAQLPVSPLPTKPMTIQDSLQKIFKFYSLFGARSESDGSLLRSSQFMKLCRECGLVSPTGAVGGSNGGLVTPADVDLSFTRAAAHAAAAAGASGISAVGANALRFEDFLSALNELSVRAYRGSAAVVGGSDSASVALGVGGSGVPSGVVAADPEAFRWLVTEFLLPLYSTRLKNDALFVLDVEHAGREANSAAFADAFLKEEVLAFFNDHRLALQAMFTRFTMTDSRLSMIGGGSMGSPSSIHNKAAAWQAVKEASTRMSKKALLAWAAEFKVVPEMISRPELLSLAKEAARAGGSSTGDAEDLSYAEWIQLLGLLAYSLGDARLLGQRNDLTSSFGVPEKDGGELNGSNVSTLPMLTRLQLLFFNMSALGAKFEGQECQKMIRSITATIRKEAAEARREAMRVSAQERTIGSSRQVQQVLQQSFVL